MYRQPLILDAAMAVEEAAGRVLLYDDAHPVVVRRQEGCRILHYLFTLARLKASLAGAAPRLRLGEALALAGTEPAPVCRGSDRPSGFPAILADENEQVLGIVEEEADFPVTPGKPKFGGFRHWPRGAQREAFPALSAPAVVRPAEPFELVIALAGRSQAGTSGALVLSPPPGGEALELTVDVVADGFDAPEGWRCTLSVPLDDLAAARAAVPLVARPGGEGVRISLLMVHFTCRGTPCGVASRRIVVAPPGTEAAAEAFPASAGANAHVTLAPGRAPDLTIRIDKPDANQATGRFTWSVESPHGVAPLAEPAVMDLGLDAASFAKTVIESVSRNEGGPLLDGAVRGVAMHIADKIPPAVCDVLHAVCGRVRVAHPGREPTVLLLSAEPHVPWELAWLDPPPDPARPPFLGAQVAVSRWILTSHGIPLPPPRAVEVRRMAVVAGDYAASGELCPLPSAAAEAAALAQEHGATAVRATLPEMQRLLNGAVPDGAGVGGVQAIHFACHGRVDGEDPKYGCIHLDDASSLSPIVFRSARVAKSDTPFLFLNACQVGNAGELLGEYAGFAGEALRGGFSGFLAPLWAVRDDLARDFALEFYRRAFSGAPVADILRELRGRYLQNAEGTPWATYLAYIFYGNPELRLIRTAEAQRGTAALSASSASPREIASELEQPEGQEERDHRAQHRGPERPELVEGEAGMEALVEPGERCAAAEGAQQPRQGDQQPAGHPSRTRS